MGVYQYIMASQSPFEAGVVDTNARTVWFANFAFATESILTIETDVAQHIEDNALGVRNTDLFIGGKRKLPNQENGITTPITTVILPGGSAPLRTQESTILHRPSFQIAVRSKSHTVGYTRAVAIWDLFATLSNVTLP